jgi:hypothetical protein
MIKGWEKTGNLGKRHQNVYGVKGKDTVIWLDNWRKGDWSVVIGKEKGKSLNEIIFEEKDILFNGAKEDAKRVQIEFMKEYSKRKLKKVI